MAAISDAVRVDKCARTDQAPQRVEVQKGNCFSLEEGVLRKEVHPASFHPDELALFPPDFQASLTLTDGEPDDSTHHLLALGGSDAEVKVVAETHHKLGNMYPPTRALVDLIRPGKAEQIVYPGAATPSTVGALLEWLSRKEDHSITIRLIAPCETFAAMIERDPELVRRKIKRIVSWGGFTLGDTPEGGKKYYTSFNLSQNLRASRILFDFASRSRVPLYILGGKELSMDRRINFDLPIQKLAKMQTAATDKILGEIRGWNHRSFDGKERRLKKLQEAAQKDGYFPEDVFSSMTPSDPMVAVFDMAFDRLDVTTKPISNIEITDDPRYEEENGEWKPTKHRAVTFEEDLNSTIHVVQKFSLKETDLDTSRTAEVLLNYFANRAWHKLTIQQQ